MNKFGYRVVAEGIENKTTWIIIYVYGCDIG